MIYPNGIVPYAYYVMSSDWLFIHVVDGSHLRALPEAAPPETFKSACYLAQLWMNCGYIPTIISGKLVDEVVALRKV